MTVASRITVFSPISDSVLSCIRARVQDHYRRVVTTIADIPDALPEKIARVDLAGHVTLDGFLQIGEVVLGRVSTAAGATDPFVDVLTKMKERGVLEVNLLGCEIGRGDAASQIAKLARITGIAVRGTITPLNAGHYGHAGLLLGVEDNVFGGNPNPIPVQELPFSLREWLTTHPAPREGTLITTNTLIALCQHLEIDYLTCCDNDPQVVLGPPERRFCVAIAGGHACFEIASGIGDRCYVRAMSGGGGDPAVDVLYEVKRGHEVEVRALMASL